MRASRWSFWKVKILSPGVNRARRAITRPVGSNNSERPFTRRCPSWRDFIGTGVALFEMATGSSRLEISGETANEILADSGMFRFRDSQIRDLWKSYQHLKDVFPLLETQLRERRILFAELWHLLKGYVASKLADWESLPGEQRDQIILATGTTFIMEQLPPRLQWLAGPIAQATALRSMRLKTVAELMK